MVPLAMAPLVKRLDAEDPGYFLEWWEAKHTGEPLREPRFSSEVA